MTIPNPGNRYEDFIHGLHKAKPIGYGADINGGLMPGWSVFTISGRSNELSTNIKSLCSSEVSDFISYPNDEFIGIASTSNQDINSGNGLRQITLRGLNSNYEEQFEDIFLNGQTKVLSTKKYHRLISATAKSVGNDGRNQGYIYFSSSTDTFNNGKPTKYYLSIEPEWNLSRCGIYTVPKKRLCIATQINISVMSNNNSGKDIPQLTVEIKSIGEPWLRLATLFGISGLHTFPLTSGRNLQPKTDIRFLVKGKKDDQAYMSLHCFIKELNG